MTVGSYSLELIGVPEGLLPNLISLERSSWSMGMMIKYFDGNIWIRGDYGIVDGSKIAHFTLVKVAAKGLIHYKVPINRAFRTTKSTRE